VSHKSHEPVTTPLLIQRIIRYPVLASPERTLLAGSQSFTSRHGFFLNSEGEGMRRLIPGLLLLAVMVGVAACGSSTTPVTTPTPTTTTATVTETFAGTLNTNGAATFPFSATAGGTVTATLASLAPDATQPIGLSLGTWTGSACQVVIANDNAAQTAVVTGTVTSATSLCVRVYDIGKVTAPVTFSVSITHP
jgi:hypothetical protein